MPPSEPATAPAPGNHCDPDLLALRAVGEPTGDPADDAHLAGCVRCQAQLDELRAIVATARTLGPQDRPEPPPDRVWAAVATELDLARPAGTADVVPMRAARRRLWTVGVAAAAIGMVLGGVAVGLWTGRPATPEGGTPAQVVASAQLTPISGSQARGTAVVERVAGDDVVHVDITGLPRSGDGFYEVWLLDPVAGRMVALGSLGASDRGTFVLPPGLSLDDYSVLDVSLEPWDGDPGHSSDSKARGTLQA